MTNFASRSHAISTSTTLLLSGLTHATNYYINHSTPAPPPGQATKDGTPPPPPPRALLLPLPRAGETDGSGQVEMTPPGTMVEPAASPKEKKLLMAKYKIFLEAIELQRRWRKEMEEANK